MKNKKAVSPLIAYIILVVIVIAMVPMVYTFLKSWIPSDPLECPKDTSIIIERASISPSDSDVLNVIVRNNGRFYIGGFSFYARNSSEGVAAIDLSEFIIHLNEGNDEESRTFLVRDNFITLNNPEQNPVFIGLEAKLEFNISDIPETLYSIDVTPIRYQVHENRNRQVICGNAKRTKIIEYP